MGDGDELLLQWWWICVGANQVQVDEGLLFYVGGTEAQMQWNRCWWMLWAAGSMLWLTTILIGAEKQRVKGVSGSWKAFQEWQYNCLQINEDNLVSYQSPTLYERFIQVKTRTRGWSSIFQSFGNWLGIWEEIVTGFINDFLGHVLLNKVKWVAI